MITEEDQFAPIADWIAATQDPAVKRHVVQFSGGIQSWVSTYRLASHVPVSETTYLIADTHAEDEDLWRFAHDAITMRTGMPLTKVEDGRDPWTVFEHEGFLGNSHVAPCSRLLKQVPCRRWLEAYCDPADTLLYVGIDWSESHRIPAIVKGWAPWRVVFPLMARPYWGKDQMIGRARALGIQPPRLYGMGFVHNNCGGACVRAGQASWAHLLEVLPERFASNEAAEQRFRAKHGNYSILKERRGGVTVPLPLSELRRRIQSAAIQDVPLFDAYDADDWGGCGCMSDFGD